MTPVQAFAAKLTRVKEAMEELGFSDVQVDQVMAGLRPSNIDGVLAKLEEFKKEDEA